MTVRFKKNIIVFFVFTFIFSLFLTAASIEYFRERDDFVNNKYGEVKRIADESTDLIKKAIAHADGIVGYIATHTTLSQDDFSTYIESLPEDHIVNHYVAIEDTTIKFAHPLEGNESGIGIDLMTIEAQRKEIERVKASFVSMLVGPVELVEGGVSLIYRMPIVSDQGYWGQLSVIIDYEKLLRLSGIQAIAAEEELIIRQLNDVNGTSKIIFSNVDQLDGDILKSTANILGGSWEITLGLDGQLHTSSLFVMLILLGLFISIIGAYTANYIVTINNSLNQRVEVRTIELSRINKELKYIIERLKTTQKQLIMKEKQAAMGELVAGVAHEINTPLGVSITAVSYMKELATDTDKKLEENILKKSSLIHSLKAIIESSDIVEQNLERASQLINSFKALSSDMHYEDMKTINLIDYMDFITRAMSPTLRGTGHRIERELIDYNFLTYPGMFSQVFTNLMMNSLIHGFSDLDNGLMKIVAHLEDDNLVLDYYDNGVGIDKDIKDKVFNPFFTTKRNEGNTGLGMNILYNIITQQLQGEIQLVYDTPVGVHFRIVLPKIEKPQLS